jgi:hypothetical protein
VDKPLAPSDRQSRIFFCCCRCWCALLREHGGSWPLTDLSIWRHQGLLLIAKQDIFLDSLIVCTEKRHAPLRFSAAQTEPVPFRWWWVHVLMAKLKARARPRALRYATARFHYGYRGRSGGLLTPGARTAVPVIGFCTREPGGSNPLMRDARNNKAWSHTCSQGRLARLNRAGRALPSQRAASS